MAWPGLTDLDLQLADVLGDLGWLRLQSQLRTDLEPLSTEGAIYFQFVLTPVLIEDGLSNESGWGANVAFLFHTRLADDGNEQSQIAGPLGDIWGTQILERTWWETNITVVGRIAAFPSTIETSREGQVITQEATLQVTLA